jgi:hypothetical protein
LADRSNRPCMCVWECRQRAECAVAAAANQVCASFKIGACTMANGEQHGAAAFSSPLRQQEAAARPAGAHHDGGSGCRAIPNSQSQSMVIIHHPPPRPSPWTSAVCEGIPCPLAHTDTHTRSNERDATFSFCVSLTEPLNEPLARCPRYL